MKLQISNEGVAITKRFFLAIDVLISKRELRGLQSFTKMYGLNYWNICTLKKEPSHRILKTEYLAYLVNDFGISGDWLLTGAGSMFKESNISLQTQDVISQKK